MLSQSIREKIIALIGREVIPAIGCTEPMAVALCAARCAEVLGHTPEKIDIKLSANILKNAMGVGIPGTGMTGLPIAVALGVLVGKSEYNLEVLRDVDSAAVERGKKYVDENRVNIGLKMDACDKLYIEVLGTDAEGHTAKAVISGDHTHFSLLELDGKVLLDRQSGSASDDAEEPVKLTMATVYEFANESPVDELRFILEARRLNKAAAERSFAGNYGHEVGKTLRSEREHRLLGDCIFSRILSYTTAASDARMAGAPFAVMSNSGSGNQGIAATLPVAIYAEEIFATEEQTIRALILSHLTVIYIKQSLGRLSALCGCVVAATGSACGLCYLMGGDYDHVAATTKNMIANLTGMICDGAKPGCSMKISSGVSTAMLCAMMAMEGHCVTAVEGIIDDDVDKSIANLTRIGRDGMAETDRLILEIMTDK